METVCCLCKCLHVVQAIHIFFLSFVACVSLWGLNFVNTRFLHITLSSFSLIDCNERLMLSCCVDRGHDQVMRGNGFTGLERVCVYASASLYVCVCVCVYELAHHCRSLNHWRCQKGHAPCHPASLSAIPGAKGESIKSSPPTPAIETVTVINPRWLRRGPLSLLAAIPSWHLHTANLPATETYVCIMLQRQNQPVSVSLPPLEQTLLSSSVCQTA